MMAGVPDGPLGLVHSSGWMTCENFLKVLNFFVQNVRCSPENKVLLIMDNHESHLSVSGLDYCKTNGIVVLTLPPHTSNKLQPLDRTVFGPFKKFFNQAVDSWLINHPGQTITIYDLPKLCYSAWDRGATPINNKSGFKCTGIFPFDRDVFSEEDYLSSYVTDHDITDIEKNVDNLIQVDSNVSMNNQNDLQLPGPSNQVDNIHIENTSESQLTTQEQDNPKTPEKNQFISPEKIIPYPKAPPRKTGTCRGRKKGKCMIATDTPEKLLIEEQKTKKNKEKIKLVKRKIVSPEGRTKPKKVKHISSSDEEQSDPYLSDSNDSFLESDVEEEKNFNERKVNDFLVVKVLGKKSMRHYAAQIIETDLKGYHVKFLKRQNPSNRFVFYEEEPAFVSFTEIVACLPNPIEDTRERFKNMFYFNVNLEAYNLM